LLLAADLQSYAVVRYFAPSFTTIAPEALLLAPGRLDKRRDCARSKPPSAYGHSEKWRSGMER